MKVTKKVLDIFVSEINKNKKLVALLTEYYFTSLGYNVESASLELGHNYMGYYLMLCSFDRKNINTITSALTAREMYTYIKALMIAANWINYAVPTLK